MSKYEISFFMWGLPWGALSLYSIPLGLIGLGVQLFGIYLLTTSNKG